MAIKIVAAVLSFVFSAVIFFKFNKSKDIKKLIMAVIFLTGFVTILCSILPSFGIPECYSFKHAGAIVIPFGLLVISLLFLTHYAKQLVLSFLLMLFLSFYLAFEGFEKAIIVISFASALIAIVLFAFIFARTKNRKMLWFIASIILFTISPFLSFIMGYGVIIHYLFLITGLLILFLIFNK